MYVTTRAPPARGESYVSNTSRSTVSVVQFRYTAEQRSDQYESDCSVYKAQKQTRRTITHSKHFVGPLGVLLASRLTCRDVPLKESLQRLVRHTLTSTLSATPVLPEMYTLGPVFTTITINSN